MTTRNRRLSPQAITVLMMLGEARPAWRYGLEIAAATGLASGSLYPLLARLAERGLLESCWIEPERPGRPARHGYRITPAGSLALQQAREGFARDWKGALA